MRLYAVIGLKEGSKDDVESIITSANLAEVEKVIERLQKSNGVLTERKRYTQVDFLTNDHPRQRFTFGARRDTLEAIQAEEAKRHQDEEARIAKAKADKKAQEEADAKAARAKLDADNHAAKEALALSLGLKKSPAPAQTNKQAPAAEKPAESGEPSDRKND